MGTPPLDVSHSDPTTESEREKLAWLLCGAMRVATEEALMLLGSQHPWVMN